MKTGYTHLVRANALHERNHGGEDHPVPCRTRQLSSPSPKVLRCSPWEDRPFRSCRAFPLSRALRALFAFPGGMGRSPRACGAGAVCRLPDLLVSSLEFIHLAFLLRFCLLGKPCIDYWAFITVQLEGRPFWYSGFSLDTRVASTLSLGSHSG